MMEQIWTFIQTLCKGTVQGIKQYIDNDLQNYIPLFVFAAVALLVSLSLKLIRKIKQK